MELKKKIKYLGMLLSIFLSLSSCQLKFGEKETLVEQGVSVFPVQRGLVNDYDNVFTEEEEKELNEKLERFNESKGKLIIVATVADFEPADDFQKYAGNLADYWDIGAKNGGNAILIVLSKLHRKVTLSVATGAKGLDDNSAQEIMSKVVVPELKENNYYKGINNGVIEFINTWK